MKHTTKRSLAREVIWVLVSIGILIVFIAIEWSIRKYYQPVNPNYVALSLDMKVSYIDYDKISRCEDNVEWGFYIYLILAYPIRYLVYLSKWALAILGEKETPVT